MTLTFYLKRHSTSNSRNEYLFLTAEQLRPSIDIRLISPQLPGNTSSELHGTNSTNFILNLGSQKATINVSGFIVPVPSGEFPDLDNAPYSDSSGVHIPAVDDGDADKSTVDNDQEGKDMRNKLYDYIADQADTDYDKFVLGYPNWSTNSDPQEWEGMINQVNSTEVAGEEDQYMFKFTFTVGET